MQHLPVNCAAVDDGGVLSQPLPESSPNGTHAQQNVQVAATLLHKEAPQLKWRLQAIFGGEWSNKLQNLSWIQHDDDEDSLASTDSSGRVHLPNCATLFQDNSDGVL
jgi:hypothetical protein